MPLLQEVRSATDTNLVRQGSPQAPQHLPPGVLVCVEKVIERFDSVSGYRLGADVARISPRYEGIAPRRLSARRVKAGDPVERQSPSIVYCPNGRCLNSVVWWPISISYMIVS